MREMVGPCGPQRKHKSKTAAPGPIQIESRPMMARQPWRDYAVYLAMRVLTAIFDAFPIEWNLLTARLIGWIWFSMPGNWGRHGRRAMDHIRLAYNGTLPESEVRRIALESMQHWVMVYLVEMAQTPRLITIWSWQRYVRLVNLGPAC